MILLAKCGKTSEHQRNHCYGHACLDNSESKCNHGRALVRVSPELSPIPICYQNSEEIKEVICKELGFPVNKPFNPDSSNAG